MKTAVHAGEALLNTDKAETSMAIGSLKGASSFEAATIILDDRLRLISGAAQDQADATGAGMFGNVIERFLDDPVKRGLSFRGDASRVVGFRREVGFDAATVGPGFDQSANGFDEAEVVECCRTQFQSDAMEISRSLGGELLKRPHQRKVCRGRIAIAERFESEIERGQILTHLVVELTRNAPAFFFLGVKQFPAERLPGGFSALALAYLAPELLVSLDQLVRAFVDKTFELSRAIGQLVVGIAKLTLRSVLFFKKIAYLKLSTPGTQRHFDRAQKGDRADWPFQ